MLLLVLDDRLDFLDVVELDDFWPFSRLELLSRLCLVEAAAVVVVPDVVTLLMVLLAEDVESSSISPSSSLEE